jgi:hypothetical protein
MFTVLFSRTFPEGGFLISFTFLNKTQFLKIIKLKKSDKAAMIGI